MLAYFFFLLGHLQFEGNLLPFVTEFSFFCVLISTINSSASTFRTNRQTSLGLQIKELVYMFFKKS